MSEPAPKSQSFLGHAKLIGAFTLLSRVMGLARDVVASHIFGVGIVATAFSVAFTIPNLFRRLLGEGALASAFIPLYAQAEKRGKTESGETAAEFVAGSFKLLLLILGAITITGEIILAALLYLQRGSGRTDRLLLLQFTAVMLPYVMLVCGGAFLSAILQVHRRFGPPAFAPVLLNVCHIAVVIAGAWWLGLHGRDEQTDRVIALQTTLAFWLAIAVLVAGVLQIAVLLPALGQSGFRFSLAGRAWSPATKAMLRLATPLAFSAMVLQASVVIDELIGWAFMQGLQHDQIVTHFSFFGQMIRYPLEIGAPRRLDLAQLLYQFPLGIFATALATAIFPKLSADALEPGRENFKLTLRQGIEAALWEGLPASLGLMLVARPITKLLFQHGQLDAHAAELIARSAVFFAAGIWAFSILQVINRAYYALHDTRTPLLASLMNIFLNIAVELPLLWWLGEAGIALGTLVSFSVQAIVMLWLLDRRLGGIGMGELMKSIGKMMLATAVMAAAVWGVTRSPFFPVGETRFDWALQLVIEVGVAVLVYFAMCSALGVNLLSQLRPVRGDRVLQYTLSRYTVDRDI